MGRALMPACNAIADAEAIAIAPNQWDAERLAEREEDEAVEDAMLEFRKAGPNAARERDRLTRIALGTSPDPLSAITPRRRNNR